jgi:chromosome segregation ATPase
MGEIRQANVQLLQKERVINTQVTELSTANSRLQKETATMAKRIMERDEEILELRKKVEMLNDELIEVRQTMISRNDQEVVIGAELSVLKKQINEKNKKLDDMKKE